MTLHVFFFFLFICMWGGLLGDGGGRVGRETRSKMNELARPLKLGRRVKNSTQRVNRAFFFFFKLDKTGGKFSRQSSFSRHAHYKNKHLLPVRSFHLPRMCAELRAAGQTCTAISWPFPSRKSQSLATGFSAEETLTYASAAPCICEGWGLTKVGNTTR